MRLLFTVIVTCALLTVAHADTRSFVTHHVAKIGAGNVPYVAAVEEFIVNDGKGKPALSLFATSYVRSDVEDARARPVVFLFNGGPSSAATGLHMELGPRQVASEFDRNSTRPTEFAQNPNSLLDVADLIVFDPAETGYSRVLARGDRAYFYSVDGDADSLAQLVVAWLKKHDRAASPRYLLGESYGSIRAVVTADKLAQRGAPVSGAIILGDSLFLMETSRRTHNIVSSATSLPLLAMTAAYHGKADRHGKSDAEFLDEVYAFAMNDYLLALSKGYTISATEKRAIAGRLAAYTGIPADYYVDHGLTIAKHEFNRQLIPGQLLDANDTRISGPAPARAANPEQARQERQPAAKPRNVYADYMERELKVSLPGIEYRALAPDSFDTWDWGTGCNQYLQSAGLCDPKFKHSSIFVDYDWPEVLARQFSDPNFRTMIIAGYYDGLSSIGTHRYLAAQLGFPAGRFELHEYPAGHATLADAQVQPRAVSDIRTFLKREPASASMSVTLQPLLRDGKMRGLIVEEQIEGVDASPQTPLLELLHVIYNVPTVATTLENLSARDEQGRLTLTTRDVGEGANVVRRWFPDRAVNGRVQVRYDAPAPTAAAPRGAAPPIELRIEAGAISGGAATVLLRPHVAKLRTRITWTLDSLPAHASAIDSLAGQPEEPSEPRDLDQIFLMAGELAHCPDRRNALGFQAVWQGEPPFDARALMQWTERLHSDYVRFFHAKPAPYTVFLRRNPVNAGGGVGMHRSFVATFGGDSGNGTDPEALKLTLAHEMFHTFQPHMTSAEGPESLAGSWFNEGLAVFYQRVLPFRAGLIDAKAFLDDLNYNAARYYTSAFANLPNSEIPARFWEDTRVRTLPYDRGFLYFATVDEAVRRASHGERSLDDLMLEMKARESAGQPVTPEAWEAAVQRELGDSGSRAFRDMLAGASPLPSSDAFGPCFRRVSRQLRRYDLGFEPKVLTESPRIVRGLVAGSNAERAGLRNGDEITRPVPQDDIQGRQDGMLKLDIRRDGKDITISYLPRSEQVPAWQWERVPGTRDADCAVGALTAGR
jgi:carboxypeptidase C (cathepsin A)